MRGCHRFCIFAASIIYKGYPYALVSQSVQRAIAHAGRCRAQPRLGRRCLSGKVEDLRHLAGNHLRFLHGHHRRPSGHRDQSRHAQLRPEFRAHRLRLHVRAPGGPRLLRVAEGGRHHPQHDGPGRRPAGLALRRAAALRHGAVDPHPERHPVWSRHQHARPGSRPASRLASRPDRHLHRHADGAGHGRHLSAWRGGRHPGHRRAAQVLRPEARHHV